MPRKKRRLSGRKVGEFIAQQKAKRIVIANRKKARVLCELFPSLSNLKAFPAERLRMTEDEFSLVRSLESAKGGLSFSVTDLREIFNKDPQRAMLFVRFLKACKLYKVNPMRVLGRPFALGMVSFYGKEVRAQLVTELRKLKREKKEDFDSFDLVGFFKEDSLYLGKPLEQILRICSTHYILNSELLHFLQQEITKWNTLRDLAGERWRNIFLEKAKQKPTTSFIEFLESGAFRKSRSITPGRKKQLMELVKANHIDWLQIRRELGS